jgi:DNA-binding MarR family transcriptional regulator
VELEHKNNVIPLPREKEYTAIIGEDNEVKAYLVKPRKNRLGVNWVAVFQTALEWLATENLQNQEYRVLMYLMSKLDFDNYLRITQTTIADALQMQRNNVSRAIKGLINHDIIITGPRVGTAKTYRLNPRMAHKGKNLQQTIIDYEELKKTSKREKND